MTGRVHNQMRSFASSGVREGVLSSRKNALEIWLASSACNDGSPNLFYLFYSRGVNAAPVPVEINTCAGQHDQDQTRDLQ